MTSKPPENNLPAGYVVPEVWTWEKGNGGQFANINRPIAGPTHEKVLRSASIRCSSIRWAPPTA